MFFRIFQALEQSLEKNCGLLTLSQSIVTICLFLVSLFVSWLMSELILALLPLAFQLASCSPETHYRLKYKAASSGLLSPSSCVWKMPASVFHDLKEEAVSMLDQKLIPNTNHYYGD